MGQNNLCESRQFSGNLKIEECNIPVKFRAFLNSSGEIEFDFDEIQVTDEAKIVNIFLPRGAGLTHFSLNASSDDNVSLAIERIRFSSSYDTNTRKLHLSEGHYSKATFSRNLANYRNKPLLKMWLLGFERSHSLEMECRLGMISLVEIPSENHNDKLTGLLQIEATTNVLDISTWHDEATKLLEHIIFIMSFASGFMLRIPIIQFDSMDNLVLVSLPQISQLSNSSLPVIESYGKRAIFQAAVNSFFNAPFEVKNLLIAISWFVMNSSYAEVRLVNSMTVLENLISSNLGEDDLLIVQDNKLFDKYRKALRKVIKDCFVKWSEENEKNQTKTLSDINENLANLNRRSLRQKIYILADKWLIPLEGIEDHQVKMVINARNTIIHKGHYIINNDLWELAMIARELVVRFILSAIGYKGDYISHIGGYHLVRYESRQLSLA
jgi:hypothetical protein